MKTIRCGQLLLGMCVLLPAGVRGDEPGKATWVEPMRKVHARFKGAPGTFAHFGDSITITMAFWAPLVQPPQKMDEATAKDYELVKKYMKPECWNKWKGPEYGNDGGMTIRWAHANLDKWLKKYNPEAALIMFGTNDLTQFGPKEYEQKMHAVVRRCLDNGTVVILCTIPPFHGRLEDSRKFADVVRKVATEEKVPLVDYFGEILKRRPDDWDGALPKFKEVKGETYEVPTLISRDGVHPSYPSKYRDFSEESLSRNGYALRSYLTLRAYASVVRQVFDPVKEKDNGRQRRGRFECAPRRGRSPTERLAPTPVTAVPHGCPTPRPLDVLRKSAYPTLFPAGRMFPASAPRTARTQ